MRSYTALTGAQPMQTYSLVMRKHQELWPLSTVAALHSLPASLLLLLLLLLSITITAARLLPMLLLPPATTLALTINPCGAPA